MLQPITCFSSHDACVMGDLPSTMIDVIRGKKFAKRCCRKDTNFNSSVLPPYFISLSSTQVVKKCLRHSPRVAAAAWLGHNVIHVRWSRPASTQHVPVAGDGPSRGRWSLSKCRGGAWGRWAWVGGAWAPCAVRLSGGRVTGGRDPELIVSDAVSPVSQTP